MAFADLFNSLGNILAPLFSTFVVALIILFVGFVLGKLAGKFIERVLHEIELDNMVQSTIGLSLAIERVIGNVISYFIYFITIVMALDQLGIQTYVLNLLSIAFLAVVIISFFLSIRDFFPSFMAGMQIRRKQLIKEGDTIIFRNTRGKIASISLTETRLETKQGDLIYLPNHLLMTEQFTKIKGKKKK
ncbi:MAG: mechanosensitive ion channel domain-containing protein [archaeon]